MTTAQKEHNDRVRSNIERRAQLDRIYGDLPYDERDAIITYLRTRGDAEHRYAEALELFGRLSADARQALRVADAQGLLR